MKSYVRILALCNSFNSEESGQPEPISYLKAVVVRQILSQLEADKFIVRNDLHLENEAESYDFPKAWNRTLRGEQYMLVNWHLDDLREIDILSAFAKDSYSLVEDDIQRLQNRNWIEASIGNIYKDGNSIYQISDAGHKALEESGLY